MKKKNLKNLLIIGIIATIICSCIYFANSKMNVVYNQNAEVTKNLGVVINDSGVTISKEVIWDGISKPENYKATFTLSEAEADYVIYYIEDLVNLSIDVDKSNRYGGKNVVLARTIDFKDSNSYKNPNVPFEVNGVGTDLNGDGVIEGVKTELTKENGKGFTPIGRSDSVLGGTYNSSAKGFWGNFYGNGNEIRNIYINNTDRLYTGLFGCVYGSVIRDLGITGTIKSNIANPTVTLQGTESVGGIVGLAGSSKIENCYNKCQISGNISIGGICGYQLGNYPPCSIKNCWNSGELIIEGGIKRICWWYSWIFKLEFLPNNRLL